jgi:hypothetical protein
MKKKHAEVKLTVKLPSNFYADEILKPLRLRKDLHGNLKASMCYILDSYINMLQNRIWRDFYDEYGGLPLQAEILNKLIGKNYCKAINILIKNGIITRTRSYQEGKLAKLISLTSEYNSSEFKTRTLSKDSSIYNRLLEYKIKKQNQNKEALSKIHYITKWFDPQRLKLNKELSHTLIEFYQLKLNGMISSKIPKGRSIQEINSRINHRANNMIDTYNTVITGEMRLKKTGKDNRLHSVVSSTKKELRMLYNYDKKKLGSVDLKASQPYLINVLLNTENWKKEGIISKAFPELYSFIQTSRYKESLSYFLMFGTFPGFSGYSMVKKPMFNQFDWASDFYLYLVNLAKAEGKGDIFPDRATTKKKMMVMLFNDKPYMDKDKSFLLLKKWFPFEVEMIMFLKKISREAQIKSSSLKGFNILPVLLQRLESYLVLEKVCLRITEELPLAPIIPVHDSIMTTEENLIEVANIFKKEMQKEIGIEPGLSVDINSQVIDETYLKALVDTDFNEILAKKPKGLHQFSKLKAPISFDPPELEDKTIIYSRYYGSVNVMEENLNDEKLFILIDDVKN